MKQLNRRLAELEALEERRCSTAIEAALTQLTPVEFAAFWRYWHRSKNRVDVWPEGDEIPAVARYEELVIRAYETA